MILFIINLKSELGLETPRNRIENHYKRTALLRCLNKIQFSQAHSRFHDLQIPSQHSTTYNYTLNFKYTINMVQILSSSVVALLLCISSQGLAAPGTTGCTINSGQKGICMATASCKSSGGASQAGHCPGGVDNQVFSQSNLLTVSSNLGNCTVLHVRSLHRQWCQRSLPADRRLRWHKHARSLPWSDKYSMLYQKGYRRRWRRKLWCTERQSSHSYSD
jgi:hypothetical protein